MTPRALRIGVDARLLAYRRGIGNFLSNLLDAIAALESPHKFVLYVDSERGEREAPASACMTVRRFGPRLYPLWEQLSLPRYAARDHLDLLYCPANAGPCFLPRSVRLVVTIHDVMYMLPREVLPASPSLYQRVGRCYLRKVVPRVARRARAITTISEFSRADIAAHLELPAERLLIVSEAPGLLFHELPASEAESTTTRLGVSPPYALAFGAVDTRKNTRRLLEAFARHMTGNRAALSLVLLGLTPAGRIGFQRVAEQLGIADRVNLLGFVSESDLVALYNGAAMLVYPSLYEGFGMPMLEAMACGTPVIASNAASLPEIGGDACFYVDPGDAAAIGSAMQRLASDVQLQRDLTERGRRRLREFSWPVIARRMLDVFEAAAS